MPKVEANARVAIVEEKLLRILVEFRAKGIMKIPKDTLCKLTGYTSTSTKTWSTAFKNSSKNKDIIMVETRNGETTVKIKKVSQKKDPQMRPQEIEKLLRKYSKDLQIQQTTFDVFEVLVRLGPRDFISHQDLAKVVNKNIATKSFTNAPKLMDSFGIIEKRGRGKKSSYRLAQSMFDQNEKKTDPQAAGRRSVTAEKVLDKGLGCEENTQTEDAAILLERENNVCHHKQQSQDEETVMETGTNLVLQVAKEDANIDNVGRQQQHKAGENIGNLSVNIEDNTGISNYSKREAEYIVEV